jgi:hypothetical protein
MGVFGKHFRDGHGDLKSLDDTPYFFGSLATHKAIVIALITSVFRNEHPVALVDPRAC